jgi:hypothetical protein
MRAKLFQTELLLSCLYRRITQAERPTGKEVTGMNVMVAGHQRQEESYERKHNHRHPVISFRVLEPKMIDFLQSFKRGERSPWILEAIEAKMNHHSQSPSPSPSYQEAEKAKALMADLKFLMYFFQDLGLTKRQKKAITPDQKQRFRSIQQKLIEYEQESEHE